jgi:nucleoside transporter
MSYASEVHSATGVRMKLSVMMFLEFFIWGAWLPLIFGYLPSLGFTPLQQSWVLNAFALASFTAMFFFTQFADRNFAAEKFVAVSHLIGGLSILGLFKSRELAAVVEQAGLSAETAHFVTFFLLMLVHSLFYVPTISITNTIAFANLRDPQHEFGPVRLWGTIGWIAASWPFVFILVDWAKVPDFGSVDFEEWLGAALGTPKAGAALQEGVRYTFVASGLASLLLAVFSLTLPHTPPKPAALGRERFAWLEAMKLLAVPYVLVLFFVTFFDASVHQCYFVWTNDYLKSIGIPPNWVMPVMSVGQFAEIGTMAVLGYCLKGLGWRNIMVLGILGHTVRFGVFAFVPIASVAIVINVMHGICYAFFFATVYIFVDEFFPKDVRSSAQGLFNFLILGLGPFVGNFVWPAIGAMAREDVPFQNEAQVVVVERAARSIAFEGKTDAGTEEVTLSLDVGDAAPLELTATPDDEGKWSTGEQYIGSAKSESVRVSASGGNASITAVRHVNFRKLLLYPSGTALFAAIVLLLFFKPPLVAAPTEALVAESEGAETPLP